METMKARLYWLMGLRVVVVTLLLGLSLGLQITRGEREGMFYGLIAFAYGVTVPYLWILSRIKSDRWLAWLAYSQVALDLTLETMLVAKTGGIESPFVVLYIISVSLGSLVPGRSVAPMAGAAALVLFGLVARMQVAGDPAPDWLIPGRVPGEDAWRVWGLNSVAFLVVGLLSGALADQLRQADRTLHEKAEGLAQLQVFHQNVIQSISSGVFTTDERGCVTTFNRAALEIMGYGWDDVRGRDWRDLFNWHPASDSMEPDALSATTRFEVECKRSDGARLILGVTMAPLHERGVQTGQVGVFKDLTELRDLEEQMRRKEWLAKLGEMSAGMAHEIRNPLGALAGAMQILRKDASADEGNRHLMDIAVREARRLDEIITAFLQYAKPPALNLGEADVNHLLADTLELIQHEARSRKRITIATQLSTGPLPAQVDANQMKQVFWNLATNAFDAMKKKGGRLTIVTGHRWIETRERSGDVVEIAFEDTGEGIDKEHLDKIFLPFFTTKQTGSGLGLAAVHRIVDQHGGWIRVESQAGTGSRFIVCLPRAADGPRLWHEGREPWKKYS
ncbi:PAS domain-containing sensor histidine kinase [Nitrospira sp.]|nr:PAS domain-containing sensor histidine kinase [Nitrospira sp.]